MIKKEETKVSGKETTVKKSAAKKTAARKTGTVKSTAAKKLSDDMDDLDMEEIERMADLIEKKEARKSPAAPRKRKTAKKAEKENITAADEIKTIVDAMLDKKAKGVCTLDLRPLGTAIADYFVICNADSTTQVQAIADNIEDEMISKCNREVLRAQGHENAFWIILDYSDIVIHIFQTEYREFYRLEELWADTIRTDYSGEGENE